METVITQGLSVLILPFIILWLLYQLCLCMNIHVCLCSCSGSASFVWVEKESGRWRAVITAYQKTSTSESHDTHDTPATQCTGTANHAPLCQFHIQYYTHCCLLIRSNQMWQQKYIIYSAVKWLIAINRIQNKHFCLHSICECSVYIYYVYINTYTCMYIFKKNMLHLYIYI